MFFLLSRALGIWIAGIEARDFGFEISPAEVRDLKQQHDKQQEEKSIQASQDTLAMLAVLGAKTFTSLTPASDVSAASEEYG